MLSSFVYLIESRLFIGVDESGSASSSHDSRVQTRGTCTVHIVQTLMQGRTTNHKVMGDATQQSCAMDISRM